MEKKQKPIEFTVVEKARQLQLRQEGYRWFSIAEKFQKKHKIKDEDMKKFSNRISRQFQRRKGRVCEVEYIDRHRTMVNGSKEYLCKFVGYALDLKKD